MNDPEGRRKRIQRSSDAKDFLSRQSEGPPLSTNYLIRERLRRQTHTASVRREGPSLESEGPQLSTKYLIRERLQGRRKRIQQSSDAKDLRREGPLLSTKYLISEWEARTHTASVRREGPSPETALGATAFNKIPHQ